MRLLALRVAWCAVLSLIGWMPELASADANGTSPSRHEVRTRLAALGVPFVEADNAVDSPIRYKARLLGGTFAVARDGALQYAFPKGIMTERFAGGTAVPR